MSKPIKFTEALIAQMTQEFNEMLRKHRMSDGSINYKKNFTYQGADDTGVSVLFTPRAYIKMKTLVDSFTSEVGWHGTVERLADDCFVIHDIMVYPQVVTGTTVNTDFEGYTKWLMEMDDDTANAIRFHGHSHVNMATSPSAVDDQHRESILAQVAEDAFYIFGIFNKRNERNIKVYDLKNNTLYEDKDVDIGIYDEDCDFDAFLSDAKDVVKVSTPAAKTTGNVASINSAYNYGSGNYGVYGNYGGYDYPRTNVPNYPTSKKSKSKQKKDFGGSGQYPGLYLDDETDYDEMIFGKKSKIGFDRED